MVEPVNDYYVIRKKIFNYDKTPYVRSTYALPKNGFVLGFSTIRPDLKENDCIKLDFNYTTCNKGIKADPGYGKISIYNTETKPEPEVPEVPATPTGKIVVNTNAEYSHNRPIKTLDGVTKGYEFGDEKYLTPIKFVWTNVTATSKEGYWVKTTEDDIEWYSLEENIWPTFSYSTASFRNNGAVTGYTNKNNLQPLKSNPFTGLRYGKTNVDDKYIFIWLPKILRDPGTEGLNNEATSYYAYNGDNLRRIIKDNGYTGNTGYYKDPSTELEIYSNNLNTKYARGTIIGWQRAKSENDGWDEILNLESNILHKYNIPYKLENQIKNINKHSNDQPMQ